VPEQFLHDFDVRSVCPQKGRIRVPEGVPPNVFGDSQLKRDSRMTLRIISCPQYDRTKGSNDKEEAELNTAWENQLLNGRDKRFEPKSQTEMFLQSGLLELSVGYGSKVVNSAAWLEFLPISDTPGVRHPRACILQTAPSIRNADMWSSVIR